MFTGIVQSTAQVKSIKEGKNFRHFEMQMPIELLDNLQLGASVANNGVCLTAVAFDALNESDGVIAFDVIDETLRLTNLGQLEVGSEVNIERSMKAGDEVGGHLVSGHVHCTATLVERIDSEDNCKMTFSLAEQWQKYLFAKGFIAVNGCSLTLGEVTPGQFSLHLIPETLQRTNLTALQVNDAVNIEIDQQTMTIVESIERIMAEKLASTNG
ncbi:riboflavin synthase subunit alpha [Thalassotalea sp. Y01]|uniref:riboflavin synthase subunit alpha n=1 Tax=Thalassotalea sp. Y01 TaxID=2729613 RepID=UPI00145E6415|nr:riboflavin synthase subunit alpha [Thalassotalea sp. Y01]NMP17507.1 riboflavin synthase subunit alpha [Thalassotalea sp. Y01]